MADSAENIANEVIALKNMQISGITLNDITRSANEVAKISEQSTKAFLTSNIQLSNDAIERVENAENEERKLTQKMLTHVKDVTSAVGLRTIVLNLGQINKYSRMIDEVTINRIMKKPSEICKYVPVQETGAS